MRKFLLSLTILTGATLAAASPADANDWNRGYGARPVPGYYSGYRHQELRRREAYRDWRRHEDWRRARHEYRHERRFERRYW